MEIRPTVAARLKRLKLAAEAADNERIRPAAEFLYGVWRGVAYREEHRDNPLDVEEEVKLYRKFHPAISEDRERGFRYAFTQTWCSECGNVVDGDAHHTEPRILCLNCYPHVARSGGW